MTTLTPRRRSSSRNSRLRSSVTSFSLRPSGKKSPGLPGSTPPWPASTVTTCPLRSPLESRLGSLGGALAAMAAGAPSARAGSRRIIAEAPRQDSRKDFGDELNGKQQGVAAQRGRADQRVNLTLRREERSAQIETEILGADPHVGPTGAERDS